MKIKSTDFHDNEKKENQEINDDENHGNNNFSKIINNQDENYDKNEIDNKNSKIKKKRSAQILKEIIGKSRDFDSKNNKKIKNNENDDDSDFSDDEEYEINRKEKEIYERHEGKGRGRERGSGGNNVIFQDNVENEELSDEDEEVCTVRTFPSDF